VRSALNLGRAKGDQRHDSLPSGLIAQDQPELELVRAKYRPAFEDALRTALETLPARDRAILSASVGEGLSIDKLAEMYGVGRSTAARWLIAARERLTAETRRTLQERLGLTPSELDSIAAAVRDDLDVSIIRLLDLEQSEKSQQK
jgi:RNA polymerase sigma-70 factor (ECF subfamily)